MIMKVMACAITLAVLSVLFFTLSAAKPDTARDFVWLYLLLAGINLVLHHKLRKEHYRDPRS